MTDVIRTSNLNYEDENRAFVANVAMRRGITLGHLRNDGGGELREIMRRLDEAIGNKPPADETFEQCPSCGYPGPPLGSDPGIDVPTELKACEGRS